MTEERSAIPTIIPTMLFPCSVRQLATRLDGAIRGEEGVVVTGVADVETAEPGDLVFAESPRYLQAALRSRAAAVLVAAALVSDPALNEATLNEATLNEAVLNEATLNEAVLNEATLNEATLNEATLNEAVLNRVTKPLIVVENSRSAFVQLLEAMAGSRAAPQGVHPTAQIGARAQLGTDVTLGQQVSLGDDVVLGNRVTLMAGVRVGDRCFIGDDTTLHPNVVLYGEVTVGRRCILHAGCAVGADGFGYVPVGNRLRKVPHVGTVEIGDEVEIGANACIDRAKTGVTTIGAGTKIDNLVHIAHNVRVGQSCLIIAQVGVAGSVEIGNGVILAGQAGIKDHVRIGDGARVGAQGGVIGDVGAGETVSGYPARPHREKMRELAAAAALPATLKRVRELEARLAALEREIAK